MDDLFNPLDNHRQSKDQVGYLELTETSPATYKELGFRCGLEIHQQLKTEKKLFCRCPAGLYQEAEDYDAEVIRHMRPTLSEMGEYDGTALMEFKTRKNITYRIKNRSACTYEIDDTPPFPMNRDALGIATEIALLLKTSMVGELHITRKQYLDGSIPTGFQRTVILGIEGSIPLANKTVKIIQMSIEEDACREVSDIGHERIYRTDRLGMPLIEMVTYPDMSTPSEAAEAADYLRLLVRTTGKVRTGIGAAREDVNVSISGGMRVEIKGVAHILWIPLLTHNEAYRQKALLLIKNLLIKRIKDPSGWSIGSQTVSPGRDRLNSPQLLTAAKRGLQIAAVNIPRFEGILSFFTQPGQTFVHELSGRLKVVACLEQPNMLHSESLTGEISTEDISTVRKILKSKPGDAQLLILGPEPDIQTALETVDERCRLAFQGVPNETRKAMSDGTTIFERVLPGPDRMYPDTDSAPIPIEEELIDRAKRNLPEDLSNQIGQLNEWGLPQDTLPYLLRQNLVEPMTRIIAGYETNPVFVATLFSHCLKHLRRQFPEKRDFPVERVVQLFDFVKKKKLTSDIIKPMLLGLFKSGTEDFESLLDDLGFKPRTRDEVFSIIPQLENAFNKSNNPQGSPARTRWMMGELRPLALGNVALREVKTRVEGGTDD